MQLKVLAHRALTLFALFSANLSIVSVNIQLVAAGQTFTNGLAIIDSPSPNNPGHAGSSLVIAVDVSGDGQLPAAAAYPGSGLLTRYDSLEIYLVSAQTNTNITVSSGPGFLTNEGGTVRHLSWNIPPCITAGEYNLTFYESSHINGECFFVITPIPIPIDNPSPSGGSCPGLNVLEPQPQADVALSQSPFLPGYQSSLQTGSTSMTFTPIGPTLVTITLSAGGGLPLSFPTVTVTATPTPTTVVLVSMATVTETEQGTTLTYTTTSTMTTVMNPAVTTDSSGGFLPVNSGSVRRFSSNTFVLLFCGLVLSWTLF